MKQTETKYTFHLPSLTSDTESEAEALLHQYLLRVVAAVVLVVVVETELATVVAPAHQAWQTV